METHFPEMQRCHRIIIRRFKIARAVDNFTAEEKALVTQAAEMSYTQAVYLIAEIQRKKGGDPIL